MANATRNKTKSCTSHRTLYEHTIFTLDTNEQTLKEEFIGPIPDPLLNWVTELTNVSSTQRWILLKSLKAASVYQFRVSAVNSVGEGPPSESSNVIRLPQEGKGHFIDIRRKNGELMKVAVKMKIALLGYNDRAAIRYYNFKSIMISSHGKQRFRISNVEFTISYCCVV